MRLVIFIFLSNLLFLINCFSQDTLNYESIAEEFYMKEDEQRGKESAAYNIEFYHKYDRLQSPEEIAKYWDEYNTKQKNDLIKSIEAQSICMDSTIRFIKNKLRIAEFRKLTVDDPALLVLINSFYDFDFDSALSFSLERWNSLMWHNTRAKSMDRFSYTENYPYIELMIKKVSRSKILQILLQENVDNDLIDLFINEFRIEFELAELKEFENFVIEILKVDKVTKYNKYFLSELEKLNVR